jgi:UDP-N-acetylmuramyl pentapeptide phosphotransferase/UDP-N-acetylglucosamine-1-phosphate transferase
VSITFIDDLDTIGRSRWKVSPIFRLFLQLLVGIIIGLTSIKISYISGLFGGVIDLSELSLSVAGREIFPLALAVTAFWYALVFNAINFSDGVPGLTAGYALISFIILAGLAIKLILIDNSDAAIENSRFLLLMLAVIIPATYTLMRLDASRKGVMGDTGTIFLAFLIATFAIIA